MRVLVFTAAIGAGHDVPAQVLAEELTERGCEVVVRDGLQVVGGLLARAVDGGLSLDTAWGNRLWDLEHKLLHDVAPTRAAAARAATALARRKLMAEVARVDPHVVVSTYPGTTEILGRLRRRGILTVPLVSAITDLAALRAWAHSGVDQHLVTQAESIPEVRAIAGDATEVVHVRRLDDPRFADLPSRAAARAALDLPPDGSVVVVSGGGWAVGDLQGAAEAALAQDAFVVVLGGSDPERQRRLRARFGDDPRTRVLGFTDRMPDVLAAADVLVHSTAGLTVMEALVAGCRVISYGWGRGHIRANNEAFVRHGMALVASTRTELDAALTQALGTPGVRDASYPELPTAGDAILRRFS